MEFQEILYRVPVASSRAIRTQNANIELKKSSMGTCTIAQWRKVGIEGIPHRAPDRKIIKGMRMVV